MTGNKPLKGYFPLYYTDDFGYVEDDEMPAFVKSMTTSEGKADRSSIDITNVWPVGKRKRGDAEAYYVVGLRRDMWHSEREVGFEGETEPEGHSLETSYWLAGFSEDEVDEFREGLSYFEFIDYDVKLKGCGTNG